MAHAPDAFSSLRSCEGAGDAVVMVLHEKNRENRYMTPLKKG